MAQTTAIDLRNKVIYQVFTRNYKEGTFKAIEDDLPRIKELGVDYLYLLPIQPSGLVHRKGSLGSPYAIQDYRVTDPCQGSMEEFVSLAEHTHRLGMNLIIDIVYNHTSPDSQLAKNHPEWFYHKKDGTLGNRIGDWWDVVDLDYSHHELWDYQIETLKQWAKYVDGFRCDVAPMVPYAFWEEARKEVEKVHPGLLWIAESIEPEFVYENRKRGIPTLTDGELYQIFDVCYDYDTYYLMKGVITGENSLTDYLRELNRQDMVYPENYIKLRCLENHDRPRAASLCPEEKVLRNWTAFNYFNKGITMIYAGEEYSATHHPSLFDHDPISFDGKDISSFLRRLAEIKKNPILSHSSVSYSAIGQQDVILGAYDGVVGSASEGMKALGVFSTTGKPCSLSVPLENGIYINEIDGSSVEVFEHTISFSGEPMIFAIKE